jgi:hypothetical protein
MNAFAPNPDDKTPTGPGESDVIGPDLREVFGQFRPADPSDSAWGRVHAAVSAAMPRRYPAGRLAGWAVAAGVLLAVGALMLWPGRDTPPGPDFTDDEPDSTAVVAVLPAAHDEDVDIHRIRPGGWKVAVGKSPIPDKIVWAERGDVKVASSTPDEIFGSEPRMGPGGQPPVIWADDSPIDKDK